MIELHVGETKICDLSRLRFTHPAGRNGTPFVAEFPVDALGALENIQATATITERGVRYTALIKTTRVDGPNVKRGTMEGTLAPA